MKILVATFRYLTLTGSETFTYTLLKALSKKNLQICFYSPYAGGRILKETKKLKLKKISNNIKDFLDDSFNVIHCHHGPTAVLLRYYFPKIPMVYLMHGPLPFLEQPPDFINFNYYGCISNKIKNNLIKKGIPLKKIFLFPNSIETKRFSPDSKLPQKPKKLLVLSNYINNKGRIIINQACKEANLDVLYIGKGKAVFNVEKYLNKADIVLSLSRGIIEAMSCGRAALVFDYDNKIYKTGDGMVTKKNVDKLALKNFNGNSKKILFNKNNILKEIKKYNQKMGEFNRLYAIKYFDIYKNLKILLRIYKQAKKEKSKKFNKIQVSYTAQTIEKLLAFEKLSINNQDLRKLLSQRFKDQLKRR